MRSHGSALWGTSDTTDVPLPTDKLSSELNTDSNQRQTVLLNCGSFNPPTIMHLRMLDVAAQVLRKAGHAVLGAYLSPVNDAYRKPGLLPGKHRIAMCQLAAAESDLIMVDTWEAAQKEAQRSLIVLQRVQDAAQAYYATFGAQSSMAEDKASRQVSGHHLSTFDGEIGSQPAVPSKATPLSEQHQGLQVRSVLVCGADVLESFVQPGVWVEEQIRQILGKHGVVCITRNSSKLHELLNEQGNLLHEYKDSIYVTEDPSTAGISSTVIRQELAQGHTVRYLTPNSVVDYIKQHGLYT